MNYQEAVKQYREYLLTKRVKQEAVIQALANNLEKLQAENPEVLEGVEIPKHLTLKTLIPELYEESPDPDVYKAQYEKANAFITRINEIHDAYNKEAIECLQKYEALTSAQQ